MLWWTQAFARLIGVYWVAVKELVQNIPQKGNPNIYYIPGFGQLNLNSSTATPFRVRAIITVSFLFSTTPRKPTLNPKP